MSPYRVTIEFKHPGGLPTQALSEHLLSRLRAAAPDADAAIELGIGRLQAGLTVRAAGPEEAITEAVAASRLVFARSAARVEVSPAP